MRVNACRLQHLLEELVSFAEIRSGRRGVRAEPVSLREIDRRAAADHPRAASTASR